MFEFVKTFLEAHLITMLVAFAILIGGLILSKILRNASVKFMTKVRIERTVISFLSQILYIVLLFIVVVSFLNKLGVGTSSLMAAIGALGLTIGLAIKDTFSNFAAGIILLIAKPFRADDYIQVGEDEGTVLAINIMTTELLNKENKIITIPNAVFTLHSIINYSAMSVRKIKFVFDIGYSSDHRKAIELIRQIYREQDCVLNAEDVEMGVIAFGSSSVQIVSYPEVRTTDYCNSYFTIRDQVKLSFDANGIEIPFSNRTLHLTKESANLLGEAIRK